MTLLSEEEYQGLRAVAEGAGVSIDTYLRILVRRDLAGTAEQIVRIQFKSEGAGVATLRWGGNVFTVAERGFAFLKEVREHLAHLPPGARLTWEVVDNTL